MKTRTPVTCKGDKGFTLVELAIVMIIIGLLIGGVLKGQELITNAQVTSTVAQIKGIDAAVSTFRDMQDGLPGDLTQPNVRLSNCAALPCSRAGNGDGQIVTGAGGNAGGAPALNTEGFTAFAQLSAADLISGVDGTNNLAFGQGLPSADIGGGFYLNYEADGNIPAALPAVASNVGHYLTLNGTTAAAGAATGALTSSQAARLDRKLDDGNPGAGSVRGGGAANCVAAAAWNEADASAICVIFSRIQS